MSQFAAWRRTPEAMSVTATAQHDYFDGQLRATHPALFEQYAAANDAALGEGASLDIAYGAHGRERFDLFRAAGTARGAVVYFHAGYWQSRDKSGFRFIAPSLVADGLDVVLVNYPLCPEVSVARITQVVMAAMPRVRERVGHVPLVLAGHSAGAQMAVEIGMAGGAQGCDIAGIVAISGVFDLAPLIATSINDRLGLDAESAHAASPLHRVLPHAPPALFAVGAEETAAFRAQTARMHRAWAAAGNAAARIEVPGADHFSILQGLCDAASPLGAAVRGFV